MSEETCPDCGRPYPVPIGAARGNTVSPCFSKFYDAPGEEETAAEKLDDCRRVTISDLRSQLFAATARASELERELALLKGRRFPVHSGGMTVPWQMLEPHEPQALANHGQTLERLASRGGLGWSEMLAVIEGKGLRAVRETTDEVAKPRVLALVAQQSTDLASARAELAEASERAERTNEALRLAMACVKAGAMGQNDGVMTWHDWAGNMLRHLNPLQDALAKLGLLTTEAGAKEGGRTDG